MREWDAFQRLKVNVIQQASVKKQEVERKDLWKRSKKALKIQLNLFHSLGHFAECIHNYWHKKFAVPTKRVQPTIRRRHQRCPRYTSDHDDWAMDEDERVERRKVIANDSDSSSTESDSETIVVKENMDGPGAWDASWSTILAVAVNTEERYTKSKSVSIERVLHSIWQGVVCPDVLKWKGKALCKEAQQHIADEAKKIASYQKLFQAQSDITAMTTNERDSKKHVRIPYAKRRKMARKVPASDSEGDEPRTPLPKETHGTTTPPLPIENETHGKNKKGEQDADSSSSTSDFFTESLSEDEDDNDCSLQSPHQEEIVCTNGMDDEEEVIVVATNQPPAQKMFMPIPDDRAKNINFLQDFTIKQQPSAISEQQQYNSLPNKAIPVKSTENDTRAVIKIPAIHPTVIPNAISTQRHSQLPQLNQQQSDFAIPIPPKQHATMQKYTKQFSTCGNGYAAQRNTEQSYVKQPTTIALHSSIPVALSDKDQTSKMGCCCDGDQTNSPIPQNKFQSGCQKKQSATQTIGHPPATKATTTPTSALPSAQKQTTTTQTRMNAQSPVQKQTTQTIVQSPMQKPTTQTIVQPIVSTTTQDGSETNCSIRRFFAQKSKPNWLIGSQQRHSIDVEKKKAAQNNSMPTSGETHQKTYVITCTKTANTKCDCLQCMHEAVLEENAAYAKRVDQLKREKDAIVLQKKVVEEEQRKSMERVQYTKKMLESIVINRPVPVLKNIASGKGEPLGPLEKIFEQQEGLIRSIGNRHTTAVQKSVLPYQE
jgi:hypothetical protein